MAINVKIKYLSYDEGIEMRGQTGISVVLKYGKGIPKFSGFPCTKERHMRDNGKHYILYMFDEGQFRFWSDGNRRLAGIHCSNNFYYQGKNYIGIKLEQLLQSESFNVQRIFEKLCNPSQGVNFRYMDVYLDKKHQILFYVWRGKVRKIILYGFMMHDFLKL